MVPATRAETQTHIGSGWLDGRPSEGLPPEPGRQRKLPSRLPSVAGIAAVTIVLAVAGAVFARALMSAADPAKTGPAPVTAASVSVAPPPAVSKACQGLSGDIVASGAGDTTTMTGTILRFEHAYYVSRDPDSALRATAPEAGLDRDVLAAAIMAVPTGTTHCVAIVALAETTAQVHLVEQHPDGRRLDYLQLINVATGPAGLVITNIQKRGD
ncbi:hypothetical protein [Nocardia asteroides]